MDLTKTKTLKNDVVRVPDSYQPLYFEAKRLKQLLKSLKRSKIDYTLSLDGNERLIVSFDTGEYRFNQIEHVDTISNGILEIDTHEQPPKRGTVNLLGDLVLWD